MARTDVGEITILEELSDVNAFIASISMLSNNAPRLLNQKGTDFLLSGYSICIPIRVWVILHAARNKVAKS